jgi:hypothetical protein
MGRVKVFSFGILFLITTAGGLVTLSGCDSGNTVSDAPLSPEAQKADEGLREGMKEFMQKKAKEKPKAVR